jgi:argininosuccinate synthase
MDDLLIEDIDDDLVREIEESARKHGKTFNEEVIYLLEVSFARELAARDQISLEQALVRLRT